VLKIGFLHMASITSNRDTLLNHYPKSWINTLHIWRLLHSGMWYRAIEEKCVSILGCDTVLLRRSALALL
jgi:hypothetical protein